MRVLYRALKRDDKSVMLRATKIHCAIGGLAETLGVHPEIARHLRTAKFDHIGNVLQQAIKFINGSSVRRNIR